MTNRSKAGIFFRISGFTQTEVDDIWIRTPIIKKALIQVKLKKRQERQLVNYVKEAYRRFGDIDHAEKMKQDRPTKADRVSRQIQNGFNIADKWRKEYDRQSEQEEEKPNNETN